ncbi:penicillin acylase family protein [Nocardioides sp. KIGAM211]|uniref:Penicillin acylase family protein n=1 Tax=Nocardioides luti TaxID=2761101 RepID=A0A7X0RLP4_9ACTN|nr:penicillin acylase family protein [Nocardioides luti]MBB6629374.1 penicillin acylase family protein [Nocardioides luti]
MRRTACAAAVLAAATALAGLTPIAAGSAAPAAAGDDPYGRLYNILPPGSNGTTTATDLLQLGGSTTATPTTPKNFADQLEMYDGLTKVDPSAITHADIERLFKTENFTPDEVVSTSTPRDDVTIQRDRFGVPFINGTTFEGVEFGAGYASTEDRMFLMDVLRHTGQARLAEFAGDTPGNVAMDRAQLASAYYTPEEATAQIDRAAANAGPAGPKLIAAVDAYLEGVNAAQDAMCPTVAAPSCPVEYAALQKQPEPWTRADIVYVASLVGGIFGKGGGHEVQNAAWLQALTKKFGPRKARTVYDDLREKNDPEAPSTSEIRTPYETGGIKPGKPGVALPDVGGKTAPGSGDPTSRSAAVPAAPRGAGSGAGTIDLPDGTTIDLALERHGMSNAVLLDAAHSATGKPLAVMGPQTGYYAPQLLTEEVLNGPGIQARGVAFAGTNLFVQLGRGVDYAWSATSAGSDNVDTVVERLCNEDGSKPTVDSTSYRVGKACRPIQQFTHSETTTPGAGSQNPPKTYEFQVLRTRHGLVQERTTVHGKPVAIVLQRSTYGHEVDSVLGFQELNDPGFVTDAESFQRASSDIDYTFNWFYADDQDISYYSSGLLPKRANGVDSDLPRWGARKYDWKGWLSYAGHAQQTNPKRGYLVSWNNKPAPGFGAADDNFSYGSVYRSLALEKRLQAQLRRGKLTIEQMVGVMSGGATADSRAASTLPLLLRVIGKDPRTAAARTLLKAWVADGAERVDRDRDGAYAHQAAIALFDDWWEHGRKSVAYTVLRGGLGSKLVHQLPQKLDDHPRQGIGSSFNGVAWYGYVNKELRSVLGQRVAAPYDVSYCGRGKRAACRSALRASLAAAVTRMLKEQGVTKVGDLTYDKSEDDIRSVTAGVVGVRPIDWQNRPTFQQVVEFTGHRPR